MILADFTYVLNPQFQLSRSQGLALGVAFVLGALVLGAGWRFTFMRYGTMLTPSQFGSIVFGVEAVRFTIDVTENIIIAHRVRYDSFWTLVWLIPFAVGCQIGFALAGRPPRPLVAAPLALVIHEDGVVMLDPRHGGKSQATVEAVRR